VLIIFPLAEGSASEISSVVLQGEVNRDGYHEYGYAENRA
jgi:hypothetical protein